MKGKRNGRNGSSGSWREVGVAVERRASGGLVLPMWVGAARVSPLVVEEAGERLPRHPCFHTRMSFWL